MNKIEPVRGFNQASNSIFHKMPQLLIHVQWLSHLPITQEFRVEHPRPGKLVNQWSPADDALKQFARC